MLRDDGVAARRGHPVLGAPLGDDAFVQDFVEGRATEARRLLAILDRLLLADPEAPPSDSLGLYAPDERALLISFSLQPAKAGPINTPPSLEALATISSRQPNDGARRRLRDDYGLRLASRAPSGSTYAAPHARRPGATAHVQRFVLARGAHWVAESGEEVDSK